MLYLNKLNNGLPVTQSDSKVSAKASLLSIVGPMSVLLSVLLLVIKESPFYIDLSVTALMGLLLCWRWKQTGLMAATALLAAVFGYDYFVEHQSVGLWDMGLVGSIQLSFIVTTLASLELLDRFYAFKNSVIAQYQDTIEKSLAFEAERQVLQAKVAEGLQKLQASMDQVKVKTESAEMFERLLNMARTELLDQTTQAQKLEDQLANVRREMHLLQEKNEDAEIQQDEFRSVRAILTAKEEEIARLRKRSDEVEQQAIESEALQTLLDAREKELADIQGKYEEALSNASDTQTLRAILTTKEEEIAHLRKKCRDYEVKGSDGQSLQNLLEAKEKELASIQEKYEDVAALASEAETLRTQLKEKIRESHEHESKAAETKVLRAMLEIKVKELSQLQDQWGDVQTQLQELRSLRAVLDAKERELNSIREQAVAAPLIVQEMSDHIQQLSQEKEALEAKFQMLEKERGELNAKLIEKGNLLTGAEERLLELSGQLGGLADRLKGLQSEKDALEKALDEALKPAEADKDQTSEAVSDQTSKANRALRKAEGLYLQLRQQFQEKSSNLDKARADLFLTQEKLLTLEKNIAEQYQYDQSSLYRNFGRHLIVLEKQIQALETENRQYEAIVSQILK